MKKLFKWLVVLAVIAALALAVGRALIARKAQQQAASEALATRVAASVELASTDVVRARKVSITEGLSVSGSLRAVNSAWLKARVAGEIRGLAVREGDTVRAGQLVARIDPTEYQSRVRQAQQQADAAKAQIDIAQRALENNKALVAQGFISTTALDTSVANLNAARANYQAALAATEVARKSVADTEIRSPVAGQVSQRLMQNGERAGVDARIVEIVDLSAIELEAAIAPADALAVRVGQTAKLTIEGGREPLAAHVVRINPSAQAGSRNVLAYLRIEQPAGLRQGLFAQGTLKTAAVEVLAVPLSSVRTDKPAPYVQVVRDGKVVHLPVEAGARGTIDGEMMVGVTGVPEGAQVLAGALGAIREGTPVRFTGAPAPGGATGTAGAAPKPAPAN